MLVGLTRDQTMEVLVAEGQRRGIPIAPVLTAEQVLASDHYLGRGAIVRAEIARDVWATVPNGFVDIDGARAGIRTRAPRSASTMSTLTISGSARARMSPRASRRAHRAARWPESACSTSG